MLQATGDASEDQTPLPLPPVFPFESVEVTSLHRVLYLAILQAIRGPATEK